MSESKPAIRLMGKKVGMTRVFDAEGTLVVCTVISAEPNVVAQVKTVEKDGYTAIKSAAGRMSASGKRRVSKPLLKSFESSKIEPHRKLFETRLADVDGFNVGDEISVDQFAEGEFVDVTGTSKGKGYQGVIKRHNYKGGPAAHGSGFHRHAGSTGMRSTPGRTFPGMTMPGQMGNEQKTVQNLKVVKVDAEKHLILVKGAIPGSNGSDVWMKKAVKKAV